MNRYILVFICLFLIGQELSDDVNIDLSRQIILLPMKKDHKYGDDICYYREIDEKLDYAVYYVKPCEKGKYCEDEISSDQPFGFCRDIPTNITDFPYYEGDCNSNAECITTLTCNNGKCKKECTTYSVPNHLDVLFEHNLNTFQCKAYDYTKIDSIQCKLNKYEFQENYPQKYLRTLSPILGTFPGFPKECGIIRYKGYPDYDDNEVINSSPLTYKSFTRYLEESREWCSIGEANDGDFVDDKRFCKSGFTLDFYPNGDTEYPSNGLYTLNTAKMCVTPTEIDDGNPLVGCVITYKGKDGTEHKYKGGSSLCDDKDIVIKSQIYTEFIEEFSKSSEEDKKHCYRIPRNPSVVGNCQNIKLLKLYYFYNNIKEYLFYKDRKDLEKVLHYKIQKTYHRYYELSSYLNINYLFFLLFLILL